MSTITRIGFGIGVAAALVLVAVSVSKPAEASPWAHICHYPPGNPDNVQFIRIRDSARPAHRAHGDQGWNTGTGECEGDI